MLRRTHTYEELNAKINNSMSKAKLKNNSGADNQNKNVSTEFSTIRA